MIVNVQATSFISIAYILMLIQFYPFGYSQNDNSLRVENDAVSDGLDLSGYFIFNDEWISRIYVRVCIYACYSDILYIRLTDIQYVHMYIMQYAI